MYYDKKGVDERIKNGAFSIAILERLEFCLILRKNRMMSKHFLTSSFLKSFFAGLWIWEKRELMKTKSWTPAKNVQLYTIF